MVWAEKKGDSDITIERLKWISGGSSRVEKPKNTFKKTLKFN